MGDEFRWAEEFVAHQAAHPNCRPPNRPPSRPHKISPTKNRRPHARPPSGPTKPPTQNVSYRSAHQRSSPTRSPSQTSPARPRSGGRRIYVGKLLSDESIFHQLFQSSKADKTICLRHPQAMPSTRRKQSYCHIPNHPLLPCIPLISMFASESILGLLDPTRAKSGQYLTARD